MRNTKRVWTTNPDCVPIFACEGVKPINGAYGVNYEPQFVLTSWVPRSRVPAFDEQASSAPPARHAGNGAACAIERNPPADPITSGPALQRAAQVEAKRKQTIADEELQHDSDSDPNDLRFLS